MISFPCPACRTIRHIFRGGVSLPANHLCQATELQAWQQLCNHGDVNARTTCHMTFNCLHHGACLAKKPGLLGIGSLCSTLVRMARAMRSTKFQERFNASLDYLASRVVRQEVPVLPSFVSGWKNTYSSVCNLILRGMSEEGKRLCLEMFNEPWFPARESESASWTHYCAPGCCSDQQDCVVRAREALRELLQVFPDIPLLYRWKHWEPCLHYAMRGTMIYRFLPVALARSANSKLEEAQVAEMDEDSPDLSFSLKQEVRLSKTISVFRSDSIVVSWSWSVLGPSFQFERFFNLWQSSLFVDKTKRPASSKHGFQAQAMLGKSFFVSTPLAHFMDEVSLWESARERLLLRSRGLKLDSSQCHMDANQIRDLNWKLISGERAWEAIVDFSSVLEVSPESDLIQPFQMTLDDYFPHVFLTMTDTYQRLCLPSKRLQVQVLRIAFLSVEEAAQHLSSIYDTYPKCCCGDSVTQAGPNKLNIFFLRACEL